MRHPGCGSARFCQIILRKKLDLTSCRINPGTQKAVIEMLPKKTSQKMFQEAEKNAPNDYFIGRNKRDYFQTEIAMPMKCQKCYDAMLAEMDRTGEKNFCSLCYQLS